MQRYRNITNECFITINWKCLFIISKRFRLPIICLLVGYITGLAISEATVNISHIVILTGCRYRLSNLSRNPINFTYIYTTKRRNPHFQTLSHVALVSIQLWQARSSAGHPPRKTPWTLFFLLLDSGRWSLDTQRHLQERWRKFISNYFDCFSKA